MPEYDAAWRLHLGRRGPTRQSRYERRSPWLSVQRSSLTPTCTAACHRGRLWACDWLDGRQVFVKAVSAEVRAHNHKMIVQEAGVLDALPGSVPAPRRLATVERGSWVALATTWAPGATK